MISFTVSLFLESQRSKQGELEFDSHAMAEEVSSISSSSILAVTPSSGCLTSSAASR